MNAPVPVLEPAVAAADGRRPGVTPLNLPLISVITVCWNAAATIEKTLASIAGQTYTNVESVIVDGLSTDGTLDIVARYRNASTKFVSGKDGGIYDAMNKGIALATGDVLYFLNADDSFVDERVLADVAEAFAEDASRLLVYGNVVYAGAPPGIVYGRATPFESFDVEEFLRKPFCHQAVFARRSLFESEGNFDTRFRYVADYEWYIKIFKTRPEGMYALDRDIAHYFYMGRSMSDNASTRREKRVVWYRHLKSLALYWYDFRYILLRGWKKKLLGEPW
jgi:glycosyltransferase involved in cell wall biosynthesis